MFSHSTVKEGATPAQSFNILTWQQIEGTECAKNIFPVIQYVLYSKKKMREEGLESLLPGCNVSFYDLHDGKMLYLLTQHSLWSRRHHPFLLCKCRRGEGVVNSENECKILSHDEQVKLWGRSLRRWEDKIRRSGPDNYSIQNHRDWIDLNNFGVSHFGLHPTKFPRESIRFDVFHLRCAITRRLMVCLRNFMMKTTPYIMKQFSSLISNKKFWSDHNVLIWNMNRPFTSFIGSELLKFIKNSPVIISFLKENFCATPSLKDLCDGLQVWSEITPFLVIVDIEDVQDYEKELQKFTANLKLFYAIGCRSFITKNSATPGDDETFYLHTLRFYMPMVAQHTLKVHGMGLGIFTMQGYERRNKESKNTLRRFGNSKGNIVESNLKRLWDIFHYEQNAF